MTTRADIKKHAKAINAKISIASSGEVWSDDKGRHYNIERAPIDWKRISQPRDTERTEFGIKGEI